MDFYIWARKLENHIASMYIGVRPSDTQTSPNDMAEKTEINEQLFAAQSSLTEGESFDIVCGDGGGNGYDAWRRLHRRWDPHTARRA